MKQYPIEDIKAPAYLFVGGSVLFIKDNIKVQKTSTRLDVATSHAIKTGDIITDQAITIKGSPVAFSNIDALFKELKLVRGARIPKIDNFYIVARVASDKWVKWTFLPAIHDTIGGITFGANLPLGEHGWTVYPDPLNPTSPHGSELRTRRRPDRSRYGGRGQIHAEVPGRVRRGRQRDRLRHRRREH